MKAKYYTYRNLNCGSKFSTKHRGLVTERFDRALLRDVEFRVSVKGNQRAVRDRKRNVHAFAVSSTPPELINVEISVPETNQIRYNPFTSDKFILNGKPIEHARIVVFQRGKLYVVQE